MRFPGFIGPSYVLSSVNVDCQRSINLYPEVNDLGTGKEHETAFLESSPGLRLVVSLPGGPIRAMWRASNDMIYAVAADRFYRINDDFTYVELGQLDTTNGPVSIADNGIQIVLVDGIKGYYLTISTSVFTVITSPDFYAADQVGFLDAYFLFNKKGTGQFFWSGLNDVTFDPLDFATAEASPDGLRGLIVSNQNVYLMGSQTIEVYYDSGDADNTFQRVQGAVIETGVIAPFSTQKVPGGGFIWLGGDSTGQGIVYRLNGYNAQRISNSFIEEMIKQRTAEEMSQATAWVYQQSGHIFYSLNIPGMKSTLVYDLSTNFWHERTYLNVVEQKRHRAECHAVGYGLNLVGDHENGNVYALDPEVYTDNGVSIVRTRTSPHISKEMKRAFYSHFQLDLETGVGLDGTGQGTDPIVSLEWSDDGGHTWSNEHYAKMGKIGQKRWRAIWRRLGHSRDRVFRVKTSEPVKVALIGADLGIEEGTS